MHLVSRRIQEHAGNCCVYEGGPFKSTVLWGGDNPETAGAPLRGTVGLNGTGNSAVDEELATCSPSNIPR